MEDIPGLTRFDSGLGVATDGGFAGFVIAVARTLVARRSIVAGARRRVLSCIVFLMMLSTKLGFQGVGCKIFPLVFFFCFFQLNDRKYLLRSEDRARKSDLIGSYEFGDEAV